MCGICFSVRQHFLWSSRAGASDDSQLRTTAECASPSDELGIIEAFSVAPCACATELLRTVFLSGCARAYRAPAASQLNGTPGSALFMRVLANTQRRGPETFGVTRRAWADVRELPVRSHAGSLRMQTELQGVSAVLGLRGHATVHQPFEMEVETDVEEEDGEPRGRAPVNKSFLQWNGEIFGGSMCPPPWGSDTVVLASRLSQLEQECVPTSDADPMNHLTLRARQRLFLARCVHAFEEEVQGPFGFLFYANQLQLAVFGRDPLGRHSLLVHVALSTESHAVAEGGGAGSRASMEVELIVSSVGVQHLAKLSADTASESHGAGKPPTRADAAGAAKKRCRPSSTSRDAAPDGRPASLALAAADAEPCPPAPAPGVSGDRAAAPPRQQPRREFDGACAGSSVAACAVCDPSGAADAEDGQHCWTELPVTGLFALPLDCPLIGEDSLCACAAVLAASQPHGAAPACSGEPCVRVLPLHAPALAQVRGRLLHCPWRDRYCLVHPLLRAFVDPPAGPPGADARALPFGLPSPWAPPPRPLRFCADDTVTALPPLLAARMAEHAGATTTAANSSAGEDGSDDAAWAKWAATCYLHVLSAAVQRRTDVASAGAEDSRDWTTYRKALRRPLCVLFSGGIDCTVLAALAHYTLPLETPIELVNVAFGEHPEQAPDRIAAMRAVGELLRLPQPPPRPETLADAAAAAAAAATADGATDGHLYEREWRLVLVDVPGKVSEDTAHILDLVTPRHTVMDLDIATALWHAARGHGRMQVLYHSDVTLTPAQGAAADEDAGPSATAEQSALAGFNKHVRLARQDRPTDDEDERGADRLAPGGAAVDKFELLIEVLAAEGRQSGGPDTPVLLSTLGKEYGAFLQPHLAAHGYKKMGCLLNDACRAGLLRFDTTAPSKAVVLVQPQHRERAVPPPPCQWFMTQAMAAAASQTPTGAHDATYTSKAKVLLLGMGADETLGGYTRYRRLFNRHGMAGAKRELEKDFAQLWTRNLGRDDRVTMDSGREPRFPYLDEELLMTLEKIVAERRQFLLDVRQQEQQQAVGEAATTVTSAAKDDDGLLQASLEPILSFRLDAGVGDKRVLRSVAAMIGLDTVTRLEKRAIQFGSRIADRRVSGTTELAS